MKKTNWREKPIMWIVLFMFLLVGCGTTNVQRKTTGGVGLGALAGGLITGNLSGAAAGAAVGGLAGYAVGTDQDRNAEQVALEQRKLELEKERNALEKAKITSDPNTAYRPTSNNKLVGSTWRVISIEGEQPFPEFHSVVSTFQTNTKLTTLVVYENGSADTVTELYQVVEDVLVISGEEDGEKYVVSGKYAVEGDQLIFVTPTYRVVTERVH